LGVSTQAFGINNKGQIVGYYYDSKGITHGFLYDGGVYTTLNDQLGVDGTDAFGINDKGQIVGEYGDASGNNHGLVYRQASTRTGTSLLMLHR
jgi:probable HAF family extracellular repeat protein